MVLTFKSIFQTCTRLFCTIMKSTKPAIKRKINTAIIAFKIPMMKLMMKMAKQNTIFIGNEQTMEPAMPDDCRQAKHIHMKCYMDWM